VDFSKLFFLFYRYFIGQFEGKTSSILIRNLTLLIFSNWPINRKNLFCFYFVKAKGGGDPPPFANKINSFFIIKKTSFSKV
jgi:hypothetical protein